MTAVTPEPATLAAFAAGCGYDDLAVAVIAWCLAPDDEQARWTGIAKAALRAGVGAELDRANAARARVEERLATNDVTIAWLREHVDMIPDAAALAEKLASRDALIDKVLGEFSKGSDGMRARVSQVTFIRWKRDAGKDITEEEKRMAGA